MILKVQTTLFLLALLFSSCAIKDKEEPMGASLPAPAPVAIPAPTIKTTNSPIYKVYYGTNRQPIDPNNISLGYSSKRADKLYTGICDVYIPKSHKIGEIKGSFFEKLIHFDASYGDIRLKKITQFSTENEFWNNLQSIFNENKEGEALIFIHGYNNTFKDAAIRTAQLGYDLGINGVSAFFSWPSAGKKLFYSSDEATIQASEKYVKEFIRGFVTKSGAKKVNIIAHSMGNRALLRAVNDIQKETPNIKFGQIILAAPDVDADLFRTISKAYTKLSERTTLYVSPRDKAVWLSMIKHAYPRAGIVRPVTIVDNIDTVEVNFNFDLFESGHTYFAQEKFLLKDISDLLKNNHAPKDRARLAPDYNKKYQKFWRLNLE
jgi:esterase/lipase superfamily enzyme